VQHSILKTKEEEGGGGGGLEGLGGLGLGLKSSGAISYVNVGLKTGVSDIIGVDVVNDHTLLIYIPVC
jgi:hypothetical protein